MSSTENNLNSHLLKQYFGEPVQAIGTYLMRQPCKVPLAVIRSNVKLPMNQLKVGLRLLLMHDLAEVSENDRRILEYGLKSEKVLNLLYYPLYVQCVEEEFGEIAEIIFSEFMNHGKLTMSQAIKQTAENLQSLIGEECDIKKVTEIKDVFVKLVESHFLCQLAQVQPEHSKVKRRMPSIQVPESKLFEIPEVKLYQLIVTTNSEPVAKKQKTDASEKNPDCDIYWGINHDKFKIYFRDKAIISAVSEFIDKKAAEVVKATLKVSEKITHPLSETTNAVGTYSILEALKEMSSFHEKELEPYLSILTNAEEPFMAKADDRTGGMYVVNTHKILKRLAEETAISVVRDRFGSKHSRIFRLILKKQYLEQKQIEELSMISPKDAKEHTYRMLKENFLVTQEISKTNDYAPSRTFFLFHVNIRQVSRMLLERCYQAAVNLLIIYDTHMTDHRRVLDKKERIEAIIASLEQTGAEAQAIEEVKALMTPHEHASLNKVEAMCKMIFKSVNEISDMILVLKAYLMTVCTK